MKELLAGRAIVIIFTLCSWTDTVILLMLAGKGEPVLWNDCQNWVVKARIMLQACAKHLDYMAYVTTAIKQGSNRSATCKSPDWAKSNHLFYKKWKQKLYLKGQMRRRNWRIIRCLCQLNSVLLHESLQTLKKNRVKKEQSDFPLPKKATEKESRTLFAFWLLPPSIKTPQTWCMQEMLPNQTAMTHFVIILTGGMTFVYWECAHIKMSLRIWWRGTKDYIKWDTRNIATWISIWKCSNLSELCQLVYVLLWRSSSSEELQLCL